MTKSTILDHCGMLTCVFSCSLISNQKTTSPPIVWTLCTQAPTTTTTTITTTTTTTTTEPTTPAPTCSCSNGEPQEACDFNSEYCKTCDSGFTFTPKIESLSTLGNSRGFTYPENATIVPSMNEMQMDIAGFGNYRVVFLKCCVLGGNEVIWVIFRSFFGQNTCFKSFSGQNFVFQAIFGLKRRF